MQFAWCKAGLSQNAGIIKGKEVAKEDLDVNFSDLECVLESLTTYILPLQVENAKVRVQLKRAGEGC